jgi:hypothetical protein
VCRAKESDLSNKLAASKAAAQRAADLAAAKQAELQLAKQQYDGERQKGIPIEQDIQRYHKSVQEKVQENLLHIPWSPALCLSKHAEIVRIA